MASVHSPSVLWGVFSVVGHFYIAQFSIQPSALIIKIMEEGGAKEEEPAPLEKKGKKKCWSMMNPSEKKSVWQVCFASQGHVFNPVNLQYK